MSYRKRVFIAQYDELDFWGVPFKAYFNIDLPLKWHFRKIRSFATLIQNNRYKVDKNLDHRMVGVKWYGKGVFHRETVQGAKFKSSYIYKLIPGSFIYNRLFAWKGSFAVVPAEMNEYYVSNEFPQFIVDSKLVLTEYLYLLCMTDRFNFAVKSTSTGSAAVSRNRFNEQQFLDFEIPIPPLETQRSIVRYWQESTSNIDLKRNTSLRYKSILEEGLLKEIGFKIENGLQNRRSTVLDWADFERWDTFFYRPEFIALDKELENHDVMNLNEILRFISRPWNPTDFPQGTFEYIDISSVSKERGVIETKTIPINKAPSRATTLVKTGDILISTTRPHLGAITILSDKYDNCVCSSGFAVADQLITDLILKEYLVYFLKSPAGLRQMERRMTGGLYPAIVQSELRKIKVPVPEPEVQYAILNKINMSQRTALKEYKEAGELERSLKKELEKRIFPQTGRN